VCPQLEVRLATKEEHLLEKDLVFEQVCRITGRLHTRAKAGKQDTVILAKQVQCVPVCVAVMGLLYS